MQDLTDSVYKPDYLPEGENPPTRAHTIKKLAFTLRARMPKTKDSERELIDAQINYFDKLNNLIQKHTHPEKHEVKKEDAERCVIYTYLVIGDILKALR